MVVLVVEVLDPLEVERLDDPLEAEVQLGATSRGHHGGPIEAVDLLEFIWMMIWMMKSRRNLVHQVMS